MSLPHPAMTSGTFAALCRTSKETLRHYKDIGLLLPAAEGDNGYQYYEPEQFFDYYLIHILKKTGTPLAQIRSYMQHQTPGSLLELLEQQQQKLTQEIHELSQMQQVLHHAASSIREGLSGRYPTEQPAVLQLEEEHLIAIPVTELEHSPNDTDRALISLLHKYVSVCRQEGLAADYQTGAILPLDSLLHGTHNATHIYTRVDAPSHSCYYRNKPAGRYLTLLDRGHWDTTGTYRTLAAYIRTHALTVTGPVYAYDLAGYLLNGVEENTMSLLMIPLSENDGR